MVRFDKIIGYSIDKTMTAQLVCSALNMAIRNQKPLKGLIVHSDRGSQYSSKNYRSIIQKRTGLDVAKTASKLVLCASSGIMKIT